MILVKPSFAILTKIDGAKILKNIESAGRTCYKSEDKITEYSASRFAKERISSGHHSVIEHENISVRFICDRGVSHEIVRHRLASYSQESTRYCNYGGGVTFVIPPWTKWEPGDYTSDIVDEIFMEENLDGDWGPDLEWFAAINRAEDSYQQLLRCKWSPQQARSILSNSLKTEIVMTANIREWRHVLKLRCGRAAHPQMRELMIPLLKQLRILLPPLFSDIYYPGGE